MTKGKVQMKKATPNGFRLGVEKEKIVQSLSDADWKHLKLMKELEETYVKDKDALAIAVQTDQYYMSHLENMEAIDGTLANLLLQKVRAEKNQIDINKGSTERTYESGHKLSVRDLEIENINLNRLIKKDLRNLRVLLAGIYRDVGRLRIDKKVFFTQEMFTTKINEIKAELDKNGLKLLNE